MITFALLNIPNIDDTPVGAWENTDLFPADGDSRNFGLSIIIRVAIKGLDYDRFTRCSDSSKNS